MDKKIMDSYINEYMSTKENFAYADFMKTLLGDKMKFSLKKQSKYEEPEYLEDSFRSSVLSIEGNRANKDVAIQTYRDFYDFLKKKGISAEVKFPPISVTNTFERLMFVAKFLHDPDRERIELSDGDMMSDVEILTRKLWVGTRTIENAMRKLRGRDNDPIQVCNKPFIIPEKEVKRRKKKIYLESTAHPLFLTPNLTQVIVMLKGLKSMSEVPFYEKYAETEAAIIWKQLSDYAKERIRFVLTEKMTEDFTWYENLEKSDDELWLSERACSVNHNVIMDCLKNEKSFCVEVRDGNKHLIYTNCHSCCFGITSDNLPCTTFISGQDKITVLDKNIVRSAYTREELA